jgi:integrase
MSTSVKLHKIKNGKRRGKDRYVWMLRWFGTNGKRYSETVGECGVMTRRDAEAARRMKEASINAGSLPRNKSRKITLEDLYERDRRLVRGSVRPSTIQENDYAMRHTLAVLGNQYPIAKIDVDHIGMLVRNLESQHLSKATIAKVLRTLKAIFNRAMKDGLIPNNPFLRYRAPRVQPRKKRIFTQEEIRAMIDAAPNQWWKMLLQLAATSGLRKSELAHLTWHDVDLNAGTVSVAAKRTGEFEVPDQGTFPILAWESKTYTERVVPIPPSTVDALRIFKQNSDGSKYVFIPLPKLARLRDKLQRNPEAEIDPFISVHQGFRAIQQTAIRLIAENRQLELSEVDWPLGTLHDLRKTYGSHVASHVPMHELRALMGHSTIVTTADYYLAPSESLARRVADAFKSQMD